MKFGLCGSLDEAPLILEAGFDYVEGWAANLSSPTVERDARVADSRILRTNGFFGGDVKFYDATQSAIERGVATALNAAEAGVELMVVGSGGARRAPEGAPASAYTAIFMSVVGAIQASVGDRIILAPEPLNRFECNVGTDLSEMAALSEVVGCKYCADSYHVLKEWAVDEIPATIQNWRIAMPFAPAHVHISGGDRKPPRADDPDLQTFVARLRELDYAGNVSVEASREATLESFQAILSELRTLYSN